MAKKITEYLSLLDQSSESSSSQDDLRQRIVYFKPDQHQLVFDGNIYNRVGKECN